MGQRDLSILVLTIMMVPAVSAQRDDVNKLAVMKARNQTSMTVGRVRYDIVRGDQPGMNSSDLTLLRVARRSQDGWAVHVYTPNGGLLMTGSFCNEELTHAEGPFSFYYPNGQLESTGMFQGGAKSGTWHRYSSHGQPLSDRIYDGKIPEEGRSWDCWVTLSCHP